ncbi:MAG TPA: hypothetical protein VFV78_08950 [Vicinamibacterales bacterium]|nr:hypothetical protein [Vicinamibacterales bacterium]
MTTFKVEVVLKGSDAAVTEAITVPHGPPSTWDEAAVGDVLVETLRAIERAQNPKAPRNRAVSLLGFSWIVEPMDGQVVLAIEIPMGAAVAGPFDVPQAQLDSLVTRTIHFERMKTSSPVVH